MKNSRMMKDLILANDKATFVVDFWKSIVLTDDFGHGRRRRRRRSMSISNIENDSKIVGEKNVIPIKLLTFISFFFFCTALKLYYNTTFPPPPPRMTNSLIRPCQN